MQKALSVSCGYLSPQRGFQVLSEFTNDHSSGGFSALLIQTQVSSGRHTDTVCLHVKYSDSE